MKASRKQVQVLLFFCLAAVVGNVEVAADATIRIDYSTDSSGFFNPNTSNGALARAAMNAAAAFYSDILNDELSAIQLPFNPAAGQPGKFYGELGGEATWYFKRKFLHPGTGVTNALLNSSFAEDEYVVFVGARPLPDSELGRGGSGGWATSFARNGSFTTDELDQINAMNAAFQNAARNRGQASGFGSWGGSIAFNSSKTWHFNHNTNPGAGSFDFFSVALHELAHALGFGGVDEWEDLVSGSSFTGTRAVAFYGSSVPLASATDLNHWSSMISNSTVYGASTAQTPIMVPDLPTATRRRLTNLDASALVDIGWQIDLPAAASSFSLTSTSGDSSGGAALTLSTVPEPASGVLLFSGLLAFGGVSRRTSMHRS